MFIPPDFYTMTGKPLIRLTSYLLSHAQFYIPSKSNSYIKRLNSSVEYSSSFFKDGVVSQK